MPRLSRVIAALALAASAGGAEMRQQSTSTYHVPFLMIDSADHVTGKTGLSPTCTCSKNAGSYSGCSGAVTEIANGMYKLAGNATDSNTLGALEVHCTATGADPSDKHLLIVAFDPFVASLQANVIQWNSTNVATPATAGIPEVDVKNINNVAASSVTTVNANVGTTQPVNFTGTGASALAKGDAVDIAGAAVSTSTAQIGVNLVNVGNAAITGRTGTAQTGSTSTTIKLDSGASSTDRVYEGYVVWTTGGTGGSPMQQRLVTAYNGTSKVATVSPPWVTTPDNTTTFLLIPRGF